MTHKRSGKVSDLKIKIDTIPFDSTSSIEACWLDTLGLQVFTTTIATLVLLSKSRALFMAALDINLMRYVKRA